MVDRDPVEPKPERRYRLFEIEAFDPVAFDAAMEELGEPTEVDMNGVHWRGLEAKFIVVSGPAGDSLVLFSKSTTHSSTYDVVRKDDPEITDVKDGGKADIYQILGEDGTYTTDSRRLSDGSETLQRDKEKNPDGPLDIDAAREYRHKVLAWELSEHFWQFI